MWTDKTLEVYLSLSLFLSIYLSFSFSLPLLFPILSKEKSGSFPTGHTAISGLGGSQEQGTPSGPPTLVVREQALAPSSANFPGVSTGSWLRARAARAQPSHPIWDVRLNPLYYSVDPIKKF